MDMTRLAEDLKETLEAKGFKAHVNDGVVVLEDAPFPYTEVKQNMTTRETLELIRQMNRTLASMLDIYNLSPLPVGAGEERMEHYKDMLEQIHTLKKEILKAQGHLIHPLMSVHYLQDRLDETDDCKDGLAE